MKEKLILDACCGSKMFWFDKENPNVLFQDIRSEEHVLCDGRKLEVRPDVIADFRQMPYEDGSFKLVVFDPLHLDNANETSYMAKKYGVLKRKEWKEDLKKGFDECMRVLEPNGILIFKWNEERITVSKVLEVFGKQPLFGHKSGKASKTHWMCFMKGL